MTEQESEAANQAAQVDRLTATVQDAVSDPSPGRWIEVETESYQGRVRFGDDGQIERLRLTTGNDAIGGKVEMARTSRGFEARVADWDYWTTSLDEPGVHVREDWIVTDETATSGRHKGLNYTTW